MAFQNAMTRIFHMEQKPYPDGPHSYYQNSGLLGKPNESSLPQVIKTSKIQFYLSRREEGRENQILRLRKVHSEVQLGCLSKTQSKIGYKIANVKNRKEDKLEGVDAQLLNDVFNSL